MMTMPKPKFITDENGNKTDVVLSLADYEALLEALEDAHDLYVVTERRAETEEYISLDELKRNLGM
jgi:PHD/YefM family antitoxin component YafN of YafNO toxin-antitoxin module